MKKTYEMVDLEILFFQVKDVIRTSNDGEIVGGDEDIDW